MKTTNIDTWGRAVRRWTTALLMLLPVLVSCSESDGTAEEFPNWKNTNESYFENLYATAQQKIAAGDDSWKVIRSWSLGEDVPEKVTNHIVVHVLNEGKGSGCPLYTDTVRVHFTGRLLPSTSYEEGLLFSQSYYGDYNPLMATPSKLAVSELITGWTTAIQEMHIGDRWQIYIPYQLGYGEEVQGVIPAYSTLIFDVTLVSYYHKGAVIPDFKAKESLWGKED